MRIIDLSRELYHRTPSYPASRSFTVSGKTHGGSADSGNVHGNSVMYFSMPDHGGTHIDAPRHFGPRDADQRVPAREPYVPGICIDLRHVSREQITPAELKRP